MGRNALWTSCPPLSTCDNGKSIPKKANIILSFQARRVQWSAAVCVTRSTCHKQKRAKKAKHTTEKHLLLFGSLSDRKKVNECSTACCYMSLALISISWFVSDAYYYYCCYCATHVNALNDLASAVKCITIHFDCLYCKWVHRSTIVVSFRFFFSLYCAHFSTFYYFSRYKFTSNYNSLISLSFCSPLRRRPLSLISHSNGFSRKSDFEQR